MSSSPIYLVRALLVLQGRKPASARDFSNYGRALSRSASESEFEKKKTKKLLTVYVARTFMLTYTNDGRIVIATR